MNGRFRVSEYGLQTTEMRAQSGRLVSKLRYTFLRCALSPIDQLLVTRPRAEDMVRMKLKEIRRNDSHQVRQALGLRLKGEVPDMNAGRARLLSVSSLLASVPDDSGAA